jgi:hypothetical protein
VYSKISRGQGTSRKAAPSPSLHPSRAEAADLDDDCRASNADVRAAIAPLLLLHDRHGGCHPFLWNVLSRGSLCQLAVLLGLPGCQVLSERQLMCYVSCMDVQGCRPLAVC